MPSDKPTAPADIPMTAVKSKAVSAYGYDAPSQTLAVTWKGGKGYRYAGVPQGFVDGIAKADSIGRYLGAGVRGFKQVR
jgi:hypothetical protein